MKFSTEARVGLVVLAGAVLLTYMTFTIGGWKWGGDKGYPIHATFDTVAGLDPKAPVKLAGVEVGKVQEIRLENSRARVTISVHPNFKIPKGSQGAIRATGLLGEKYLEIIPGKEDGYMAAGDTISETLGSADMEALIAKFGSIDLSGLVDKLTAIADDIKSVSASLRGALGTAEGEASLTEIVQNIRDLSRNMSSLVRDNGNSLSNTVANFESFSRDLKEGMPDIVARVDSITAKLDSIVAKLEGGEGTLGKLLTEEEVYAKLDSALEGLDKVTTSMAAGEGTIGKLLTDEKAYEELTKTLEGLGEAMTAVRRFRIYVEGRNEYQLNESDNKGYFSLRIQPRPDKYYLVEVVDDPRGKVGETITQIDDGTPVRKLETKRRLKFSALLAKRFADLTLRAGLMENTFGVGADYFLLSDRVKFSFDSWDFNSDDPEMNRVHLKAYAQVFPLQYIFLQGGYDNFLNRDIDTYFVGGGIRFEDEDLKYLLGTVPIPLR
jgi:phospholipid/cholesterol/gamma-HCH transport system substrate-binding protein